MHLAGCGHTVRVPSCTSRTSVIVHAKGFKGFGSPPKKEKKEKRSADPSERKARKVKQVQPKGFRPNPKGPDGKPLMVLVDEKPIDKESLADELDFEERLKTISETGALLAKEKKVNAAAPKADIMAGIGAPSYSNPPSLLDTVSKAKPDDPDKVNPLGNSQLAVTFGTLILGSILIFSSVDFGDGSMTTKQNGLTDTEKVELRDLRDKFDQRLKDDSTNVEALEGAAVTYANLGDYKKSEQLLVKLSTVKGDDVDVWRLLGETRTALKETGKAVDAFEKAYQLAGTDVQVLKDYTTALVADGRPAAAITILEKLAAELKQSEATTLEAGSITPIEVDLLLGKVYTQWGGHTNDALRTYDGVITDYPADFRGFLAKGVFLRQEGRKGDADRAFLKARFLTPKELRGVVDKIAAPEQ